MAGHSKWANIKHRKERQDAARGKAFTRVTKEIIQAVKQGGVDPKTNAKLRLAIAKAKAVNLPSANIERNIKRAASGEQAGYDEFIYELYGHGGVGILAIGMTDNRNRLASDIRIAINKCGGTIAAPGSVLFNFDYKGLLRVKVDASTQDALFLCVSNAGAEDIDFESAPGEAAIMTPPDSLAAVRDALEEEGFEVMEAELEYLPKIRVECSPSVIEENEALLSRLEGIEDVDDVIDNLQEKEDS